MDHSAPEGLIEHFSKLDDPRVDRNKKHELCARLTGASAAGGSPAGGRRPATTSTPSHGPLLARAGVKR